MKDDKERKIAMENNSTIKISEDFSFNFKNDITISQTREVLRKYENDFQNAFSLQGNHPIFLDTNILLNYYGMSSVDKEKLETFLKENIKKIYITQQIEQEFQRNRISAIENYYDELKKIKTDYKKDLQEGIKNQFSNILQSKIVEKDFPEIRTSIVTIYEELEEKLFSNQKLETDIKSKINKTLELHKNLIFLDPILETYSNFQRIPNLDEDEIKYLNDSYLINSEIHKNTKESNKGKFSFPGCGEKKKEDAAGDYIIFHEILKFMFLNKKDIIFLTRDVTKSDWLQKSKDPFVHYIEKAYQLTGKLFYIFDATDLLSMISFENIYQTDSSIEDLDDETLYFIEQFKKLVNSIEVYIKNKIPENYIVHRVTNRNVMNHDVDLIIESPTKKKNGLLVYNCNSNTRNAYRRSIQKRINACNKLINDGICDSSTLIVNLNHKRHWLNFDYEQIASDNGNKISIIIGKQDYSHNGEFVELMTLQV